MTINNVVAGTSSHFSQNIHLYRQALATFAGSLLSLAGGLTFGYTAVLLPQLEDDKSYPYDKSYDSWIASISPLAMMMGCLFSGVMSDALGRKTGQLLLVIPYSIGWVVMGFANNNGLMLLGRFITGICTGAVRPLNIVYIGELTTPKYRSITLFVPSMAIYIGSLISHTVGKYVYWKTSCFLFIIPNIACALSLMILKESPLWYISKGREKEGIESFKFFRGTDEDSQKELTAVIEKTKEKADKASFKDIMDIIFSKPFFKSLAIILFLFIAVQCCGVNTLSFYSEDIYKKTFADGIDSFLLMLLTDVIRLVAAIIVCIFARLLPRKNTFIICCYLTSAVLAALVVYLYINPVGLIPLAITIMVIYITVASVITCISWSFIAEIFPSKIRGFGSGLSSGISFALLFISVKVTPNIMYTYGEAVMYGSFGAVTLVSAVLLNFILPETNGKTLQEIENSMYNKKKGDTNEPTSDQKPLDLVQSV